MGACPLPSKKQDVDLGGLSAIRKVRVLRSSEVGLFGRNACAYLRPGFSCFSESRQGVDAFMQAGGRTMIRTVQESIRSDESCGAVTPSGRGGRKPAKCHRVLLQSLASNDRSLCPILCPVAACIGLYLAVIYGLKPLQILAGAIPCKRS